MYNKKKGSKVIAVTLAAVMTLLPVGTTLAENGWSVPAVLENIRNAYSETGSFGPGNSNSSTGTSSGTRVVNWLRLEVSGKNGTEFQTPVSELDNQFEVKAWVVPSEGDTTGGQDITEFLKAHEMAGSFQPVFTFTYYDKDGKKLDSAPTEAGAYYVEAGCTLTYWFHSATSNRLEFAIRGEAQKQEVTLKVDNTEAVTTVYGDTYEELLKEKVSAISAVAATEEGEAGEETEKTVEIDKSKLVFTYYKGEEVLDAAPKDAGEYTVGVSLKEDETYADTTAEDKLTLEIGKKDIAVRMNEDDKAYKTPDEITTVEGLNAELTESFKKYVTETCKLAYEDQWDAESLKAEVVLPEAETEIDKTIGKTYPITLTAEVAGDAKENYTISLSKESELEIVAEKQEVTLKVDNKEAVTTTYGDGKDQYEELLKEKVSAISAVAATEEGEAGEETEKIMEIDKSKLVFTYYKGEVELDAAPKDAGDYTVEVSLKDDETYADTTAEDKLTLKIGKKDIAVRMNEDDKAYKSPDEITTVEDLNAELTESFKKYVTETCKLAYEDQWDAESLKAEVVLPEGETEIDKTIGKTYPVTLTAEVAENVKENYTISLSEESVLEIVPEKQAVTLRVDNTAPVTTVYGDAYEELLKEKVSAVTGTDTAAEIDKSKLVFTYYKGEEKLDAAPKDAGEYAAEVSLKGDAAYKDTTAEAKIAISIDRKDIRVMAGKYGVKNGAAAADIEKVVTSINAELAKAVLSYEDKWAEGQPSVKYTDADGNAVADITQIDTKTAHRYQIIVSAEIEEGRKDNYNLTTENGFLNVAEGENGKTKLTFEFNDLQKTYDAEPFVLNLEGQIVDLCGYKASKGSYDALKAEWYDSEKLTGAPKDAGTYTLKLTVPEDDPEYTGSVSATVTIDKKEVTPILLLAKTGEEPTTEELTTVAGVPLRFSVGAEGFLGSDTWAAVPKVKITEGDVNKAGSYKVKAASGDAGRNYAMTEGKPLTVTVTEPLNKNIITSDMVTFPKNKTDYTAVYNGEPVCPAMTVTFKYTDTSGKSKTQKLKLNVDYIVSYADNVNASVKPDNSAIEGREKATVTVMGIGEYAGVVTKEYGIEQKKIKGVTLAPVGDIFEGDAPKIVATDGIYELPGTEYTLQYKKAGKGQDWSGEQPKCGTEPVLEKVELRILATGNGNYYTSKTKKGVDEGSKSVKFNILGEALRGKVKPISTVNFAISSKQKALTYNGKAQKPKIEITGEKIPASQYKAVYNNNVNAGSGQVRLVGVIKYNKKNQEATGYYGVSDPVNFDIAQKSFKGVKVSSVAAIPKSGSILDTITLTVKDGKRILTEGRDYDVDYSALLNEDGTIKAYLLPGTSRRLILTARPGGNYIADGSSASWKEVTVKLGQLNLASKTADIKVSVMQNWDEKNNRYRGVEYTVVTYNGSTLEEGRDYTDTIKYVEKGKDAGTYTVTIKGHGTYKGTKAVKALELTKKNINPIQQTN